VLECVRPAAIRPLDVTGKDARDEIERMDGIRKMTTMAGSPDADLKVCSASGHLAHGFVFWPPRSFVNP
jgi:hypothetical protein